MRPTTGGRSAPVPQRPGPASPLAEAHVHRGLLENLHELAGKIDTYLATPDSVNTDGLMGLVRTHLSTAGKVKKSVTVTLSTSDNLASIGVGVNTKDVSGNIGVGVTQNTTKVLYP